MRVLICPDKFKGTLTAQKAAEAIQNGWRQVRPDDQLELLPMSDGGDGFGELLGQNIRAETQYCQTVDAAHRPRQAPWWWETNSRIAIVESAQVIGLALLPSKEYHPFQLDTSGLGPLFQSVTQVEPAQCLVGIGGSATNDAGFGMARALGWSFFDAQDREIDRWTGLRQLAAIRRPVSGPVISHLRVAVDVQNPLLGKEGASRIYGPQKGLRPEDLDLAESCLAQLASVFKQQFQIDVQAEPGAGAAGGLGFGLRAFLGASLEPGFQLFAEQTGLADKLSATDMVITGEGAIDPSTLMGKGVGELAQWCRRLNIPCLALVGAIPDSDVQKRAKDCFTDAHSIVPDYASVEEAIRNPETCLQRLAQGAAKLFDRKKR